MSAPWTTPKPWPFDREKFVELLLYIAKECAKDRWFGDTKLNKIMFKSEVRALERLGSPITGQRFQKEKFGQTSRALVPVRDELKKRGLCDVEERIVGRKKQFRTVVKGDVVLERMLPKERAIVDAVIKEDWGKTATRMSAEAHEELGWRLVEMGEDIPYETLGFHVRPLSSEEKEHARTLKR